MEKWKCVFKFLQLPKDEKPMRGKKKCLKEAQVPTAAAERRPQNYIAKNPVNMPEVVQKQIVMLSGYFWADYLVLS